MKITELLLEKPVTSTWITELSYNRPNKIITMVLNNGKKYYVYNITRTQFEKWVNAPSKGKHWHNYIAGNYQVKRVKQ